MDDHRSHPAVDALALAMMNSFGQLSLILAHMHRHQAEGHTAPDALDPPFALAELLKQVLGSLAEEHDAGDVATAAQMLGPPRSSSATSSSSSTWTGWRTAPKAAAGARSAARRPGTAPCRSRSAARRTGRRAGCCSAEAGA